MGARPSSFKKSGGRLNGVDGVITGYEFTTVFPFQGENKPTRKSDFNSLWFVLSARVDGADEDILEPVWAGNADNFDISDDGLTLTPVEAGFEIGANTDFGKFVASLVEAGFPETNLSEDEINYEAIVGTRVRFIQVQQIDAKTGKPRKRLVSKGKFKGREFDQTSTQVSHVLGLPGTSKPASKAVTTTKVATKPMSKANGKIQASPSEELQELANSTLTDILGSTKDGSIAKNKLRMAIMKELGDNPQRPDVIKLLFDDAYLASVDGVLYDASDKSQTISLA